MVKPDQLGYYNVRASLTLKEFDFIRKYCHREGVTVSRLVISALNEYFKDDPDFKEFRTREERSFCRLSNREKDEGKYGGDLYRSIREWALMHKYSYEYTRKIQNIAYRLNESGVSPDDARGMDLMDMINTLAEGAAVTKHYIRTYTPYCNRYSEFLRGYYPKEAAA